MFAPLGGVAPPLQCNRVVGGTLGGDDEEYCGKDATWHVIWTSDLENGLACDEHMDEIRRRWMFFAVHPYEPTCSMPDAVYVYDENRCVIDEDEDEDELVVEIDAYQPFDATNACAVDSGTLSR